MSRPPDYLSNQVERPDFLKLWVVVSVIWTIATVLRMHRVWVPVLGWNGVLGSLYAWVTLLLPPWMFAIILLAVKRFVLSTQRDAG